MEKRKLAEARNLIQSKKYREASRLLETMLDNDQAMKWYLQLQQIMETQKSNDVSAWRNNRHIALILAIALMIALVLFLRAQNGF